MSDGIRSRGRDITGLRFGRLVVVEKTSQKVASGFLWLLKCDCGNEIRVVKCNLDAGYYQSCGCYRREFATKHGMSGTPEYQAWADMIDRCHNPKNSRFKDYGGRGIAVCDRWRSSFEAFYAELGSRPDKHLLDRIDNEKGYESGNCRWVSSKQSARNRRTNHVIEHDGRRLSIHEWAEVSGLKLSTIKSRLRYGWSMEEILAIPVRYGNRLAVLRNSVEASE